MVGVDLRLRGYAEGQGECEKTKRHAVFDSNKQAIADGRLEQRGGGEWRGSIEDNVTRYRARISAQGFYKGNVTGGGLSVVWLEEILMAKYALYVSLKAKPGKEKDVEAFLKQGAEMAKKEAGTVSWYGLKEDCRALQRVRYVQR